MIQVRCPFVRGAWARSPLISFSVVAFAALRTLGSFGSEGEGGPRTRRGARRGVVRRGGRTPVELSKGFPVAFSDGTSLLRFGISSAREEGRKISSSSSTLSRESADVQPVCWLTVRGGMLVTASSI